MILESGGEVAQHRIVLRRQGHEIRRVRRHDLVDAPVEIIQVDRHVQRRADVEPDGEAMELAHNRVLEAAAHELLAGPEDLRTDESSYVVHVNPGPPLVAGCDLGGSDLTPQRTGEPVLARLVDHHVEPEAMSVRGVGPLPGFEVEAVPSGPGSGVARHLVDRDVERPIRVFDAGQALEPERGRTGPAALHLGLHVDVRQDAMRKGVFEAKGRDQVGQGALDGRDRIHLARNRVGAQEEVAHRVGPPVEYLPDDVVDVVGRGVGLNPGTQVRSSRSSARTRIATSPRPASVSSRPMK